MANPATDLLKSVIAKSLLEENSRMAVVISANFLLVTASISLAAFSKFSKARVKAFPAASKASSPDRDIKSPNPLLKASRPGTIYLLLRSFICASATSLTS